MDVIYGAIGGICTGIAGTLIVLSGREDRLRRRIRQETNRADTWRRNYCYLQDRMDAEAKAEREAAVAEVERLITKARAA